MKISVTEACEKYVGNEFPCAMEDLVIMVKVLDIKTAFSRWHVKVTPVAGNGAQWVSIDRLIAAK